LGVATHLGDQLFVGRTRLLDALIDPAPALLPWLTGASKSHPDVQRLLLNLADQERGLLFDYFGYTSAEAPGGIGTGTLPVRVDELRTLRGKLLAFILHLPDEDFMSKVKTTSLLVACVELTTKESYCLGVLDAITQAHTI